MQERKAHRKSVSPTFLQKPWDADSTLPRQRHTRGDAGDAMDIRMICTADRQERLWTGEDRYIILPLSEDHNGAALHVNDGKLAPGEFIMETFPETSMRQARRKFTVTPCSEAKEPLPPGPRAQPRCAGAKDS